MNTPREEQKWFLEQKHAQALDKVIKARKMLAQYEKELQKWAEKANQIEQELKEYKDIISDPNLEAMQREAENEDYLSVEHNS